MQNHTADDRDNSDQIDRRDPIQYRILFRRHRDVNTAHRKLLVRSRVAFAAGACEVRLMYTGC